MKRLVKVFYRYEKKKEEKTSRKKKPFFLSENDSENYSGNLSRQSSETKPNSKLVLNCSKVKNHYFVPNLTNPKNKMFVKPSSSSSSSSFLFTLISLQLK